jgi:murein DD-endopeptidase MepM/ murein hydrolase activator NlpD
MRIQPTMWRIASTKAWWNKIPGGVLDYDVHAGTDFAGMPAGSPLVAMQAGIVTRSEYDGINGGGHVVEVEIRPGVRYSFNHCNSRLVYVGQKVTQGQKIATVGATGTITYSDGTKVRSAFGVHCHTVLTIRETLSDGITRSMIYNLFPYLEGQALANSSIVAPAGASYPTVRVRNPVNIRSTPDLDVGSANILYVSRADGIFRVSDGARVASATTGFQLRRTLSNDDGTWGELYGFKRLLYVMKGLYY